MQLPIFQLLLRIITLDIGIKDKYDFMRAILSEIHPYFEAQESHLFIRDDHNDTWNEITYGMDMIPLREVSSSTLPVAETGTLSPLLEQDSYTQLWLPLQHKEFPLTVLRLAWKGTTPPQWINEEEVLKAFNELIAKLLDRKQIILQLEASKQDLQTIFDHFPHAVTIINSDFIIERMNRAFAELFDVTCERGIGTNCFEVIHNKLSPHKECCLHQVIQSGKKRCMTLDDGRLKVTLVPLAPLLESSEKPKVMEIFEVSNCMQSVHANASDENHLQLSNCLNQPLTALSLLLEIMLLDPNRNLNTVNLKIIQKEIQRMMAIIQGNRE